MIIIINNNTTIWLQSFDSNEENKHVRPYFLIRPQSVLVLPNEIGKSKEEECYTSLIFLY